MFFEPINGHGLSHNPFKAIVSPRPIGWISTRSDAGIDNLAPYSFFNAVCDTPPLVMFSSGGMKDSARNAIQSGVFAVNIVSKPLIDAMNQSSALLERDVSEFDFAHIEKANCSMIDACYVLHAPAVLECRVTQHMQPLQLDGSMTESHLIFGEVVGVRIQDELITNGRFDNDAAQIVARLGYMDYTVVDDIFALDRPRPTP